jgi:hypothetical protein
MLADGGQSTEPNNKAGPEYGVGYCDSQCPRDLKFIGGQVSSRHVLWGKEFSADNEIFRPTSLDGLLPQTVQTLVSVTPDPAVPRWTSGKQTQSPTHSPPTLP